MIQADTLKPGWKLVKFGDVVRLSKERAANPEAEGIERYVGLEHIDPDDLRIRRWGLVAEGITFTSKFKPGQVLFGKRRAYQRKLAVADFEGVCSGDIYVFESANPKVLLPELLPFICQTDRFFEYAVGTSAGSLSPRTNWTSLAKFEFALPSLEEQEKIKYALILFEENINLYFQAICQIESIIQSLMFRWLSVITNGANKPYLEFKELPYNYKIYSIGEFTQCLVPGRTKPKEFAGDIPWVTTSDINSTIIDSAKVECYVKKDELARVGGKTVPQGSVIMTCVGELGITALAPTELSFTALPAITQYSCSPQFPSNHK
jgi:type I restriction enzyme, S subunit